MVTAGVMVATITLAEPRRTSRCKLTRIALRISNDLP
jgi:hypothetical protein